MRYRVILDTDIGGDPDDTFALLLALKSPEIQLEMIVTCDEHQGHRAAFAKRILQSFGREIPVCRGIDLGNEKYCLVDDLVGNADFTEDGEFLPRMREIIKANPKKTYYVCIGPQSNLAAFLQQFPGLRHKLQVIIMGGALQYRHEGLAEHNIRYDIPAARKVFNSDVSKQYIISDVTFNDALRVDANHPLYTNAQQTPCGAMIKQSMDSFFNGKYSSSMMHDPLTLSVVFGEYVQFKSMPIEMDDLGVMRVSEKGKPTVISTSADYGRFMRLLHERLQF